MMAIKYAHKSLLKMYFHHHQCNVWQIKYEFKSNFGLIYALTCSPPLIPFNEHISIDEYISVNVITFIVGPIKTTKIIKSKSNDLAMLIFYFYDWHPFGMISLLSVSFLSCHHTHVHTVCASVVDHFYK